MDIIAWSIPAFVLAMCIELWVSRRRGKKLYRFSDAVADLNCGVSSEAVKLLTVAATTGLYYLVWREFRLIDWEEGSPWPWVIAFIGLDFLYYWWHRVSHVSNLFWAAHVVHHQSEDYNLAVALRQAWFSSITSTWFYLPLALLGVGLLPYAVSNGVSLLYQFWIHTQLVDKMPRWFAALFNTPAHHRVHHAINPQYLDKNYAAISIVWDRMFGTFEPEVETPVYGITDPLDSWNAPWANTHRLVEIGRDCLTTLRHGNVGAAVWVWFSHPAWVPPGVERTKAINGIDGRPKYDPIASPGTVRYVAAQMLVFVPVLMLLLLYVEELAMPALVSIVAVVVLGTGTLGALLEGKRWSQPVEVARMAAALALVGAFALGLLPFWS
jgi:sterol desaturase/sphingolipid hydroxylase (fatty acid hydroxylase superfamily)